MRLRLIEQAALFGAKVLGCIGFDLGSGVGCGMVTYYTQSFQGAGFPLQTKRFAPPVQKTFCLPPHSRLCDRGPYFVVQHGPEFEVQAILAVCAILGDQILQIAPFRSRLFIVGRLLSCASAPALAGRGGRALRRSSFEVELATVAG